MARAGKVRGQTPKVAKQDKKKKPRGRAHKRMQYKRRFVTAVVGFGKKRGPNSSENWLSNVECSLFLANVVGIVANQSIALPLPSSYTSQDPKILALLWEPPEYILTACIILVGISRFFPTRGGGGIRRANQIQEAKAVAGMKAATLVVEEAPGIAEGDSVAAMVWAAESANKTTTRAISGRECKQNRCFDSVAATVWAAKSANKATTRAVSGRECQQNHHESDQRQRVPTKPLFLLRRSHGLGSGECQQSHHESG
nr:40S ribosomal protein S30 [Ipomoea batatas]